MWTSHSFRMSSFTTIKRDATIKTCYYERNFAIDDITPKLPKCREFWFNLSRF